MPDRGLHVQQTENVDRGRLQVNVTSTLGLQPVVNARVSIAYTGEGQRTLEELQTDSSGQTEEVTLDTPPLEYSQEPATAVFRIYGNRTGRWLSSGGGVSR